MTARDVRAAAQAEADKHIGGFVAQTWFVEGAVFGAALVTPSREQIALVLCGLTFSEEPCRSELVCEESIGSHAYEIADAVLALMQEELAASGVE